MTKILTTVFLVLAIGSAFAQPRTIEQVVAAEVGQCVLQRAALTVEIETLRARVAQLEKDLAAKAAEPPAQK